MNITVINGTEKHGVTYRLKEMFLAEFRNKANITEYYLPKDCPSFCTFGGRFACNDIPCLCVSCYGSNESIS